MKIVPVLLDSRPAYLSPDAAGLSLLLMPLERGTLLSYLRSRLAAVTPDHLTVLRTFMAGRDYMDAVLRACPDVERVLPAVDFWRDLGSCEPSDWLLMCDPRFVPVSGFDLGGSLLDDSSDLSAVIHFVAMNRLTGGTVERIQLDAASRVRRIQRYYDSATWPLSKGVVCSLVPAAAALLTRDLRWSSLTELRTALVSRGVPSRDRTLGDGAFDLTVESGLLALNEQLILDAVGNGDSLAERRVHWNEPNVNDAARVIGPVAIHGGAVVEEGALIVGPSTIGAGAVVGRNAVLAQSLVASGASVAPSTTVRHRVVTSHGPPGQPALPRTQSGLPAIPVRLRDARRSEPIYPQAKALVEPFLASLALLLLSPLMIVIGLLVKLTSRGSVLYGDRREGKDGRVFRCWKFRTMIKEASLLQRGLYVQNQVDGPQFNLANDPRITAIGRWLRPTSLDELPQLINVALAQMSLVGPRPSPFRENQTCIPWRQGRLSVRPGVTGLWQVCRSTRAAGDFHQWIYYDLLYIRSASFWVDLKIIFATVLTLGGRGHVPLSWIVPPERYYERRLAARDSSALTIWRLWSHT